MPTGAPRRRDYDDLIREDRDRLTRLERTLRGVTTGVGTGNDANFVFNQSVNTTAPIVVLHNLNKEVSVTCINTLGIEVELDVTHDSLNQVTVQSTLIPFAGKVICN